MLFLNKIVLYILFLIVVNLKNIIKIVLRNKNKIFYFMNDIQYIIGKKLEKTAF